MEAGIDGDTLADLSPDEMRDLLKDLRVDTAIDRNQFVSRMRRLSIDGVDEAKVTPRNTPQRSSIWSDGSSSTSSSSSLSNGESKEIIKQDGKEEEDDDLEKLLKQYTEKTTLGRVLRSLRNENTELKRTILAQSLHPVKNSTKNWIFRDPEDRIGEGAFAEVSLHTPTNPTHYQLTQLKKYQVFRVYRENVEKKVIEYFALKRLKVTAYENVNEIEALRNEVAIHSTLHHPSVVSLIETYSSVPDHEDEESSIPVLHMIMEYADHGTLHDVIHDNQHKYELTRDVVWHYVVQLFSALFYLHENNIVHRDIKPLNVFLSGPDGRIVKLGT